jgi:hypothetical protein
MITLKTLHLATEQEVFNQVATHLLTQKSKCLSTEGNCKYRAKGKMCAAGCLIGDEEYREEMDTSGFDLETGEKVGSDWVGLNKRGLVPENHKDLIECLQEIHDHNPEGGWKNRLIELAGDFALISEVCNKF